MSSIDFLFLSFFSWLLQSIIVNEKYQILSGHRRFEAIQILGWKEVDVEIKEIDESETDFYLVQFNKQRVKSTKELLNEYEVVEKHIQKQQGKRSDLTFVRENKSDKPINRKNTIA